VERNKTADLFGNVTIEEIAQNPHRYGAPTFEEFLKGQYVRPKNTEEDKLAMLDNGPGQTRKQVRKIRWIVDGHICDSPEMAQRVANDENIDLRKYLPELRDVGNHKCDIYLHFNTKKEFSGLIKASR
jgi:hypothetical protein